MSNSFVNAENENYCSFSNHLLICGSHSLLKKQLSTSNDFDNDDYYSSEINSTAASFGIAPNEVKTNLIPLRTEDELLVIWREYVSTIKLDRRFDKYFSDKTYKAFYELYPNYPPVSRDVVWFHSQLDNNKTATTEIKPSLLSHCKNIGLKKKKSCIGLFSSVTNFDSYIILLKQWTNTHRMKTLSDSSMQPNIYMVKNKNSRRMSPKIDLIGNLYLPEIFVNELSNEEIKLIMLHEASHLYLVVNELNEIGALETSYEIFKNSGEKYAALVDTILDTAKQSRKPDEYLVDLFTLSKLKKKSDINLYLSLLETYNKEDKNRRKMAGLASDFIDNGHNINRLIAALVMNSFNLNTDHTVNLEASKLEPHISSTEENALINKYIVEHIRIKIEKNSGTLVKSSLKAAHDTDDASGIGLIIDIINKVKKGSNE